MSSTANSQTPEALALRRQVEKRLADYEPKAERAMFVDLPKSALHFDSLLKTHPLLQTEYYVETERRLSDLLGGQRSASAEMAVSMGLGQAVRGAAGAASAAAAANAVNATGATGATGASGAAGAAGAGSAADAAAASPPAAAQAVSAAAPASAATPATPAAPAAPAVPANLAEDMDNVIKALSVPPLHCFELESLVKRELTDLLEVTDRIKMALTLRMPKAGEMGYGDKILAELTDSFTDIEEDALGMLDTIMQFHTERGKLVVKLQKRKLYDIAQSVIETDLNYLKNFRESFYVLHNKLVVAYDSLIKNDEALRGKRSRRAQDVMY